MSGVSEFLGSVRASKHYRDQIVHVEHIPARQAVCGVVKPDVSGEIGEALSRVGVTKFYSHQADSINAVRRGENIVVVTPTASGKTLCYNVPVIESLEANPSSRALYIYPTKALAQDQLGKLREFRIANVRAATYDGDTPKAERTVHKGEREHRADQS